MLNAYSLGFVGVAALVATSVDYYDQSSKGGFALGQMTVAAYVDTIPNRFSAAKQEKQDKEAERERQKRWRAGGLPYLPEAPEGWTRRALLEGDDSAIMPPEDKVKGDSVGQSLLDQMQAREAVKQAKERAKRSWIYQRGTETVFVEIKTVERADSNSLIGLVSTVLEQQMWNSFDRNQGYGVVGGVALTEKIGRNNKRPYHFRFLEGSIGFGHEIHLQVHANASREATYEILNAIDFDGLNSLLPEPMDTVGNDVSLSEEIDEIALSMALRNLRSDFLHLRGLEAQYRIANIDTNALLVNTYATSLAGFGAPMDITQGKQINLSLLVEMGYRIAVKALMEGKSPEQVQADVKQMIDTAVQIVDAETAAAAARAANAPEPEMSPELKAELASLAQGQNGSRKANTSHAAIKSGFDAMMVIDPEATAAADGLVRSMQGDAIMFKNLAMSMGVSDKMAELSMQQAAVEFEKKHDLPFNSCRFVASNVRFECDHAQSAKSEGNSKKLVSKPLSAEKIAKLKQHANDPAMQIALGVAVKEFEEKHDLPRGSCEFSMENYRVECDPSQQQKDASAQESKGLLGGVLGALGLGKSDPSAPTEPVAKPQRLQLSNGSKTNQKRCVGSFCD